MKTLHANLIGRFGNQLFTYAYARALAEERGYRFSCCPWLGDRIFDLNETPSSARSELKENDAIIVRDYCQNRDSLIYTRKQVKNWFRFKPEIEAHLQSIVPAEDQIVCHTRRGDYKDLGYVVVSISSYLSAMIQYGFGAYQDTQLIFVTEGSPRIIPELGDDLSFLPDFYLMTKARVLFRANSSFSWWAATLSDAEIYSPIIDGLEGGKEQECLFVKGNWPKFVNLPFITDLHLPEQ